MLHARYLGTVGAPFAPADLRTLNYDTPERNDEQANRNMLEVKYVLPDGITLRSVSGYQSNLVKNVYDSDATANPAIASVEDQDVRERPFTQEINIISPTGNRLSWIGGFYYWYDRINVGLHLTNAGVPGGLAIDGTIITNKKSVAGFARVLYQLTDQLKVEVGGRYTEDTVNNGGQTVVSVGGFPFPPTPQTGHYQGDNWTGKFAIDYDFNDDNFIYAFVAKGVKAGGPQGTGIFRAEKVWDYELGWKSTLLNHRMTAQVSGFYDQYDGFQVDAIQPTTGNFGTVNTQGSTIYGVEFQTNGHFGGLSYDLSTAWVGHRSVP